MSRSNTRRAIQPALQRAVLQAELHRSRLDELPAQLAVTLGQLPALAASLDEGCSLVNLRSALDRLPEATPLLAIDLLAAELPGLQRQAAEAGLEPDGLASLADEVGALRAGAPTLSDSELRAATDAAFAAAERLEADVVDAASDARARSLAVEAVMATLGQMGLEIKVDVGEDGMTIHGSGRAGLQGAVSLDGHPPAVEAAFEHPDDAVHPLHPASGEPCRAAIGLALQFHTLLEAEALQRGLRLGRVEARTRPTRGALGNRRRPPEPPARRTAAS